MSANDSINGRVTIHAGTRYGGKAQHSYDYYRNENCDTLVERTKKFSVQKDTSVRMGAPKITSVSVNAEKIQWVGKRVKKYRMINCPCLSDIIKKLITGRSLLFNPLYKTLFFALRDSHIPPVARFCIVATGVDPKNKKKMGTFIKVRISDEEFVLPNSFLRDGSGAFLKSFG